jgi:hypothetical protein
VERIFDYRARHILEVFQGVTLEAR